MMEIGRLVVKIAGRDAGKRGAIIDVIDSSFVVVEGDLRRKKCNVKHLEPIDSVIKISKNAPREEVESEMKRAGFEVKKKSKTSRAKSA